MPAAAAAALIDLEDGPDAANGAQQSTPGPAAMARARNDNV